MEAKGCRSVGASGLLRPRWFWSPALHTLIGRCDCPQNLEHKEADKSLVRNRTQDDGSLRHFGPEVTWSVSLTNPREDDVGMIRGMHY